MQITQFLGTAGMARREEVEGLITGRGQCAKEPGDREGEGNNVEFQDPTKGNLLLTKRPEGRNALVWAIHHPGRHRQDPGDEKNVRRMAITNKKEAAGAEPIKRKGERRTRHFLHT